MTVLCREYGISRKTGYKWLERYRREGGLRERSHPPLRHSRAHEVAVVQAVPGLRDRRPHGGRRNCGLLGKQHPELPVPAASTIGDWLQHEGKAGQFRRRPHCPAYTP